MSDTSAAPSSTEPSIITEIVDEFKSLGEKVEHLIHPEEAREEQAGETFAAPAEAAPVDTSATTSASAAVSAETQVVDDPNAAAGAVAQPATQPSAPVASMPAGIPGIAASSAGDAPVSIAAAVSDGIRQRIAAIKGHLQGFEESGRQKILSELDGIERLL